MGTDVLEIAESRCGALTPFAPLGLPLTTCRFCCYLLFFFSPRTPRGPDLVALALYQLHPLVLYDLGRVCIYAYKVGLMGVNPVQL